MNKSTFQSVLAISATATISVATILAGVLTESSGDRAVDAAYTLAASHRPTSTRITEDDPRFRCATMGNLICGTPALRAAVKNLARRPAEILPGQWSAPAGPALVTECFQSYPNHKADHGVPNRELMICLQQPDPRRSDRRVLTFSQAHRLHQLHLAHQGR